MKPTPRLYSDHMITAVLALLSYALFFYGLGSIGLVGPDEPRYAAIAREMVLTGDYITPRLYGMPWFEKPPLMYWLAALAYRIFGFSEAGARFPSALSATLCVFLIYWCGRKLWGRAEGFLVALVAATSIGSFVFARAASMDMLLTACLTAALVFFLFSYNDPTPRRRIWQCASYASLGLAVLAKGPVGLLLPALSLGGFILLRGRWREWRDWYPKGLWITLAIAGPWYLFCTMQNGREFLQIFFINHNVERFTSTSYGHDRPFLFFLPVLLEVREERSYPAVVGVGAVGLLFFLRVEAARLYLADSASAGIAHRQRVGAPQLSRLSGRCIYGSRYHGLHRRCVRFFWEYLERGPARQRYVDFSYYIRNGRNVICPRGMVRSPFACRVQCDGNRRSCGHCSDDGISAVRSYRHDASMAERIAATGTRR